MKIWPAQWRGSHHQPWAPVPHLVSHPLLLLLLPPFSFSIFCCYAFHLHSCTASAPVATPVAVASSSPLPATRLLCSAPRRLSPCLRRHLSFVYLPSLMNINTTLVSFGANHVRSTGHGCCGTAALPYGAVSCMRQTLTH